MAGRARIKQLFPFVYPEIKNNGFSLDKILSFGTLPPVFLSEDPWNELKDYAGTYLKEEILNEAIVRRIDNFSRFLEIAALTNGQVLNFESVGSDAQVPARTVREYYAVLVDTLMGYMLEPIRSTKKRKSSATAKFYFFDVGVVNSLTGRKNILRKTKEYGDNLEHFVFLELQAYKFYKQPELNLSFWGVPQKGEIDFILNEEIAIEVKATHQAAKKHFHGFELFSKNNNVKRKILVCLEQYPRKVNDIEIMPVADFLENLWNEQIIPD
jgi:predicted AAA+ superfamily ATPase